MIRIALAVLAAGLLLPVPAAAQHSAIPCFDRDFGTNLNLGNDQTVAISLPFTFMFPGGPSNTISVCSNGFLWVGSNLAAPAVPSENDFLTQPARIAPLWVDLDPSASTSGGVWARVTSSRAVITWNSVPITGSGITVTMQVQLLPHGTIVCHYENTNEAYRTVLVGVHGQGNNPAAVDLSSVTATPIDTGARPDVYEVFTGSAGFDLRMRSLLFSPTCCGGYRVTERAQCHSLYFADRSAPNTSSFHEPGFYDAVRGEIVLPTHVGQRTLVWNGSYLRSAPLLPVTPGANYFYGSHGWQACQDPTRPGAGLFLMSFPPNLLSSGLPPSLWRFDQGSWARLAPPGLADVTTAAMAADTQRRVVVCHDSAGHRTFEFDGTSWAQVQTQNFPPQGWVRMAFDSLRSRMVLVHNSNYPGYGTWEYFNSDWHQVSATNPPLHTMVYDTSRGRIVTHGYGLLTWEWDGSTWLQVGTPPPPVVAFGPSEQIVYDEHRRETMLIRTGIISYPPSSSPSDVWAWNGSTWTQRLAPGVLAGPSLRSEAVACHDAGLGAVVVFGGHGVGGQVLDETWLWSGQSWRDRTGAVGSPGARSNAAMAWLPAGARGRAAMTVLHGGVGPQSNPLGDTWGLDAAGTWQPLTTGGRTPPARYDHAMVATDGGELILFGGSAGLTGFLGDTWELDDLSQWANTSPVTAPPARDQHAMAWDPLRGRAVLFGGRGQGGIGTVLADTWEYDPVTHSWTDVTPAGGSPPGRWNHSLVYDPRRARTMLFGGGNGFSGLYDDVWEWDGVRWVARGFDSLPPTAAWQMAATWDATNQRIFAFGGEAIYGTPQSATWEITAYEDRVTFDRENYRPLQVTGVPIAAPGFPTALKAEFAIPNILGFALLDFGPRAAHYAQISIPLGCAPDNVWPAPLWTGLFIGSRAFVNVPLPYFAELPSVTFWLQGLVHDGSCVQVTEARAILCQR